MKKQHDVSFIRPRIDSHGVPWCTIECPLKPHAGACSTSCPENDVCLPFLWKKHRELSSLQGKAAFEHEAKASYSLFPYRMFTLYSLSEDAPFGDVVGHGVVFTGGVVVQSLRERGLLFPSIAVVRSEYGNDVVAVGYNSDPAMRRGYDDALQDTAEQCPWSVIGGDSLHPCRPDYIPEDDWCLYWVGYQNGMLWFPR